MGITSTIIERARHHGFDAAGVAPARLEDHEVERFLRWLRDGNAATMGYLERNAAGRGDAETLLPGARSVLLVAARYAAGPSPHSPQPAPPTSGQARLSNYARGRDYHRVMGERLRALAEEIPGLLGAGTTARPFVDTAPILERSFARIAGLGWFGKNACLIHPRLGSYFFIGGLVIDRDLEPSTPFETDHCGTCTACIDACPTDAIVSPRTVDSRRCITYFTVEHRGPIPEAIRAGMGSHVFGCDICQAVCPWNKFAAPPTLADLAARPDNIDPPLADLITRTRASFRRAFRDTAVVRAGKRGLLRNAAVAAGNSGDPSLRPLLEEMAADADPLIAEHALWGLERLEETSSHDPGSSPPQG